MATGNGSGASAAPTTPKDNKLVCVNGKNGFPTNNKIMYSSLESRVPLKMVFEWSSATRNVAVVGRVAIEAARSHTSNNVRKVKSFKSHAL